MKDNKRSQPGSSQGKPLFDGVGTIRLCPVRHRPETDRHAAINPLSCELNRLPSAGNDMTRDVRESTHENVMKGNLKQKKE